MPIRTKEEQERRRREREKREARSEEEKAAEVERQKQGEELIKERERRATALGGGRGAERQAFREISEREQGEFKEELGATITPEEEARLEQIAVEQKVFEEPIQEILLPPEQENLSVMGRIVESLIPDSISKTYKSIDTLGGLLDWEKVEKGEPITQAEMTTIEEDMKDFIETETSAEIDARMEETEEVMIQNGIPLIGIVGGAILVGTVAAPVKEFVGTDGQIASLELALSQYNEMLTIPSRSIDYGLSPEVAFDKYNRMESGILALEAQLKLSAITSPKVALALRGRGVEARLLKLKEKIQEGRRKVWTRIVQESFGEVNIPASTAYLRRLQNDRKK